MKRLIIIVVILLSVSIVNAQDESYEFKSIVDLGVSTVKSQDRTGTCWCYSTVSFLESELIRMGKPEYDLSEMYFVKKAYEQKASNYIKTHGKSNFSQGGQAHDVLNEIKDHGIVPESVYLGRMYDSEKHNHNELSAVLTSFLDGVLKAKNPTNVWYNAFNAILDIYLGEDPESFEIEGKSYTPQTYAKDLGININDYVELTSYTDMPYYKQSTLLIPDNWSQDQYYNVHLDELMDIMKFSLMEGYTFVWDGDVSDKGFSHKNNVAVVDDETDKEKSHLNHPIKEKAIDADFRQAQYNSFNVTDDHLMHIVGLVKDQNDVMYYKTKNSWGTKSNEFGGFLNMSEEFMRLHTVAIMVHKNAIPKDLKKKLDL
jgi:bleomycin hydrolase